MPRKVSTFTQRAENPELAVACRRRCFGSRLPEARRRRIQLCFDRQSDDTGRLPFRAAMDSIPGNSVLRPSEHRTKAPTSPARIGAAKGGAVGGAWRGTYEARYLPCEAFVRDTSAGRRLRYSNDPGAAAAQLREHDHGRYAGIEPRGTGPSEPGGRAIVAKGRHGRVLRRSTWDRPIPLCRFVFDWQGRACSISGYSDDASLFEHEAIQ